MVPFGSIFFPLTVTLLRRCFGYIEIQTLNYDDKYQHTKDLCPFNAYNITEFEFGSLIFRPFLFIPDSAKWKMPAKYTFVCAWV